MKEKSYVMVKPWFASNNEVVNEIKRRLLEAGLKIEEESYIQYDREHARQHYKAHILNDFYPYLENYITSSEAYGMIVTGEDAISVIRTLVGSTKNPNPGTIRYDIPTKLNIPIRVTENVVHASDSVQAAEEEIEIFNDIVNKSNKIDV